MNENAKDWVEALRTANYQQGKGVLHQEEKFCCLGVACDLAVRAGVIPPPIVNESGVYSYQYEQFTLTEDVMEWLGLNSQVGVYAQSEFGAVYSLANDNDKGKTFLEIADTIEREQEALFVPDPLPGE